MSGYARTETKPMPQPLALAQPDEPGLRADNVANRNGNAAIGHHIRQQNRYYRQIVRKYAREHTAAQVIRALSMLVFSVGIVTALLISLTVLLPRLRPESSALPQPGPSFSPSAFPTATPAPRDATPAEPSTQPNSKPRPTVDRTKLSTSQHILAPSFYPLPSMEGVLF